ncbi:MAG: glycosyltransferase [bacterium]
MANPFFSIIIPALNEERYLPHLLKDLSIQSYQDFEVIVVDGKSDDKTVIEAKKWGKSLPSLKIMISPRRHVCTQRNLGATKAKGEYFVFMDADNHLPPYYLLGIKYKLESDPTQLATTLTYTNSTNTSEISIINTINVATELSKRMDTPLFSEAMTIISSTLFLQINGFDETIDFSEGTELIHRSRKLGFDHTVYHDPRYEYSLRRIRTYGILKLVAAIGQNQLAKLTGETTPLRKVRELYPMKGGSIFANAPQSRTKKFTQAIDKLLRNISIEDKPLTLKTLRHQLDKLLS